MNPNGITIEYIFPKDFTVFEYLLLNPIDWKADWKPCNKCNANKINATT